MAPTDQTKRDRASRTPCVTVVSGFNTESDVRREPGQTATAGDYTFRVTGTDAQGNSVAAQTFVRGKVTGVKFENGGTYLMVGTRTFSLADITQILDGSGTP